MGWSVNLRVTAILLSLTVFNFGCSKYTSKAVPGFASTTESPKKFTLNSQLVEKNNTLIVVDRAQLGTKLVWSVWLERVDGSLYQGLQSGIPSESMLVYFRLSDDKKFVQLFEEKENPQDPRGANLVDRFPIVDNDQNTVTFDFSEGLPKRFFRSFIDPKSPAEFNFNYSAVYDFENSENVVSFSQLMKLVDKNASTLILHHAFRLFETNNGFTTVKVPNPISVGIMPATFTSEQSEEPVAIRRWDIRQPIKFYISSNTPVEFQPAIMQGLKRWNIALGSEFIQVEVLKTPVSWGNARINLLQWSEDQSVCGTASAIGPSEANPITGQIYSGKIIFCWSKLSTLYDKAIVPETISREEFNLKLIAWAASHEMGHVLGYLHNFKGKLYRDPQNPELLNSTVMDYPAPAEIPSYKGVGPADDAKLAVSYLQTDQKNALDRLKHFPFCTDEQTAVEADCNIFARGGLTPAELTDRYFSLISSGKPYPEIEHNARSVIFKRFLTEGSFNSVESAKNLLKIYPKNKDLLINDLVGLAAATSSIYMLFSDDQQRAQLEVLSEVVSNPDFGMSFDSQKKIIGTISNIKTLSGYSALQGLSQTIETSIQKSANSKRTVELLQLKELIKRNLEIFWQ